MRATPQRFRWLTLAIRQSLGDFELVGALSQRFDAFFGDKAVFGRLVLLGA